MGGKTLDQFHARQKSKTEKDAQTGTTTNKGTKQGSAPYTLGAHRENSD